jgi:hypothetical protein
MVQNIDSILQRGERLDLLVDKTDTLAGQAYAFRRGARNVRRQQWWKNMRIMMLMGVVGVVRLPIHSQRVDADSTAYLLPSHSSILRFVPHPLPIIDPPTIDSRPCISSSAACCTQPHHISHAICTMHSRCRHLLPLHAA